MSAPEPPPREPVRAKRRLSIWRASADAEPGVGGCPEAEPRGERPAEEGVREWLRVRTDSPGAVVADESSAEALQRVRCGSGSQDSY